MYILCCFDLYCDVIITIKQINLFVTSKLFTYLEIFKHKIHHY